MDPIILKLIKNEACQTPVVRFFFGMPYRFRLKEWDQCL